MTDGSSRKAQEPRIDTKGWGDAEEGKGCATEGSQGEPCRREET